MLRKVAIYFAILFFAVIFFAKNSYAADSCTQVFSSPSPLMVDEQHFNVQARFDNASRQTKFTSGDYFITIGGNAAPYDEGPTKQRGANATLLETGFVSTIEEFNLSDGFRWGIDKKLKYGTLNIYVWKKNPDQLICEGSTPVLNTIAEPATTNSCPLCQDGYSWNYTYDLCQNGADYKQPIRRINCSDQGTRCVVGKGYCDNPAPPDACKTYGSLNSNCNPANGDPGDCDDNLLCQDESSKCVRAQARLGSVCYKCRAAYVWNGQYCADGNNNTCIAPESRAYCAEGSSCTQGKGCQKNTEPPPVEVDKSKPLKTPCEKSLSGTVNDGEECAGVFSGLGVRLPTDPLELIPQILSVILGISGGIVILLIIRAGYKLMFSQGNPEKVQEARDELTSAIVGLLFIIFSFVLLQFITNDLLKIQDLPKGEGLKTK